MVLQVYRRKRKAPEVGKSLQMARGEREHSYTQKIVLASFQEAPTSLSPKKTQRGTKKAKGRGENRRTAKKRKAVGYKGGASVN